MLKNVNKSTDAETSDQGKNRWTKNEKYLG